MCGRILAVPLFIFWILALNALVISLVTRANSEDYQMQIIQYILCCVILLLFPPISWIYALIYWIYNGCKMSSFSLEDIAICECWDGGTSMEESLKEIAVLRQMLEDFQLKNQA